MTVYLSNKTEDPFMHFDKTETIIYFMFKLYWQYQDKALHNKHCMTL